MSVPTPESVKIRSATPADVPFLAWVMLAASRSHVPRGIWEFLNDYDEVETLAFLADLAVSDVVHWCHYSLFLVADVDGAPRAGLCGYDPVRHGNDVLQPAFFESHQKRGTQADAFADIAKRSEPVDAVSPDYAPGAWVIENVATKPEYRRRGLVDALLGAVLERGREGSFEQAQIAVFIGNEPARRSYLKRGFSPHDEKRDPDFERALGFPGIERLLQPL